MLEEHLGVVEVELVGREKQAKTRRSCGAGWDNVST